MLNSARVRNSQFTVAKSWGVLFFLLVRPFARVREGNFASELFRIRFRHTRITLSSDARTRQGTKRKTSRHKFARPFAEIALKYATRYLYIIRDNVYVRRGTNLALTGRIRSELLFPIVVRYVK